MGETVLEEILTWGGLIVMFLAAVLLSIHYRVKALKNFRLVKEKYQLKQEKPYKLTGMLEETYPVFIQTKYIGENKKLSIKLLLQKRQSHKFTFKKEATMKKLGLKLGLAKEDISLRDDIFDKAFNIQASNPLFVKRVFADPSHRENFLALLNHNFHRLVLKGDSLEIYLAIVPSASTVYNSVSEIIPIVLTLAKELDSIQEDDYLK